MMLMGNLMQWKFRMPSIFKGALRSMTEKTVHDVCTKTVWKKGRCTQNGSGSTPVQRASGIFGTMDDRVRLQRSDAGQKGTETESQRREIKEKEF